MTSTPQQNPQHKTPKYRRQRRKNGVDLAFVEIEGQRHYLGPYDTPQSRERYHRRVAEWESSGHSIVAQPQEITVTEVASQFLKWSYGYYVVDGKPTAEPSNIALAIRPLNKLYAQTKATDFGPRAMKAVRDVMIRTGWSRRYINRQVGIIKRMFKWAVAEELVPPSVYHGLQAVCGLKWGRCGAREAEPVQPVADEIVVQVKQRASRQIAAMIDLQLLTGARPGEIVIIRPCDIQRQETVWEYRPGRHKTKHLGRDRVILLGPLAQAILQPFLLRPETSYCFSPAEAEQARRDQMHERRTTPINSGNRPGTNRQDDPLKKPGDHYTTQSYGRSVRYLCEELFPLPELLAPLAGETMKECKERLSPDQRQQLHAWQRTYYWHPHQLRHNYATHVRKDHGLEATQILLGHSKADVTQIYAERDMECAKRVALKIG